MNVITCNEKCRHQNQGYCGLNHITQLTSVAGAEKCGYFEPTGLKYTSETAETSCEHKNMNDT